MTVCSRTVARARPSFAKASIARRPEAGGLSDPFAFSPGEPFTIGVEEELLLVRDCDRLLEPRAAEIVTEIGQEQAVVHTDLYSALLELASPVRRTADGAVAELARLRSAAVACGSVLLGAGIHPAQPFGGVHRLDDERYRKIAGDMRGLVARTPTCALHVHVGLPDAATAVRVTNGMRDHLPLVQALSANSPFWHGVDSGLASARVALFRSAPRSEIPRAFTVGRTTSSRPALFSRRVISPTTLTCGGTYARIRGLGRSRCGPWTRSHTRAPWPPWVPLSRPSRHTKPSDPPPVDEARGADGIELSRRTRWD